MQLSQSSSRGNTFEALEPPEGKHFSVIIRILTPLLCHELNVILYKNKTELVLAELLDGNEFLSLCPSACLRLCANEHLMITEQHELRW